MGYTGKTLVWGACGFIGRHLVSTLLDQGQRVAVLTRDRNRYARPAWAGEVEWFDLLHEDSREVRRVFDSALADTQVVYDLAGQSGAVWSNLNPLSSLESICSRQLEMLEACQRVGVRPRIVLASSRLVYGQPDELPVTENAPLRPASMYAAHKIGAENHLRIYAMRGALTFVICRITNPYGVNKEKPSKGFGFINHLIQAGLAGRPLTIYGNGRQLRDYIHIEDLCDALALAGSVPAAAGEVFNLGSGEGIRIQDAAEKIRAATGGAPVVRCEWPREEMLVETGDFVACTAKAKRILQFSPRWSFDRGLVDLVAQLTNRDTLYAAAR